MRGQSKRCTALLVVELPLENAYIEVETLCVLGALERTIPSHQPGKRKISEGGAVVLAQCMVRSVCPHRSSICRLFVAVEMRRSHFFLPSLPALSCFVYRRVRLFRLGCSDTIFYVALALVVAMVRHDFVSIRRSGVHGSITALWFSCHTVSYVPESITLSQAQAPYQSQRSGDTMCC